jgi:hypothetical protein
MRSKMSYSCSVQSALLLMPSMGSSPNFATNCSRKLWLFQLAQHPLGARLIVVANITCCPL